MRKPRIAVPTLLTLLFASCSLTQHVDAAKAAVKHFHEQLDSGQFAVIYAETDPQFKSATSEQQFTDLLAAIHRKLGKVTSAEVAGWKVNTNTNGAFVALTYTTHFGAEQATEKFDWRLVGYRIESAALVTK